MAATDQEHLNQALERAAWIAAQCPSLDDCSECTYLTVWRDAVKALDAARKVRLATDDWQRECVKQAHSGSHMRCGECFLCLERKTIDAFIKTMLEVAS